MRLWSRLNTHQTAAWDQMILTTGKYLWAEKSNSGRAWRCTGRSHQPSLEFENFTYGASNVCVMSPWSPFYAHQPGASWPQCWVWPPSVYGSPANNRETQVDRLHSLLLCERHFIKKKKKMLRPLGLGWAHFPGWVWLAGSVYWQQGRGQRSLVADCISSDQTFPGGSKTVQAQNKKWEIYYKKRRKIAGQKSWKIKLTIILFNCYFTEKRTKPSSHYQLRYLKLDVVYRRRRDDAVEGSEAVLVADLLAVQLELRLTHLPVHIQRYHRLKGSREDRERMHVCALKTRGRMCGAVDVLTLYKPAHMFW